MKLTITHMAVFRYLLENAFYTDDNRRGWVRHDCCGIDTIAAQIMSSPVTHPPGLGRADKPRPDLQASPAAGYRRACS